MVHSKTLKQVATLGTASFPLFYRLWMWHIHNYFKNKIVDKCKTQIRPMGMKDPIFAHTDVLTRISLTLLDLLLIMDEKQLMERPMLAVLLYQ